MVFLLRRIIAYWYTPGQNSTNSIFPIIYMRQPTNFFFIHDSDDYLILWTYWYTSGQISRYRKIQAIPALYFLYSFYLTVHHYLRTWVLDAFSYQWDWNKCHCIHIFSVTCSFVWKKTKTKECFLMYGNTVNNRKLDSEKQGWFTKSNFLCRPVTEQMCCKWNEDFLCFAGRTVSRNEQ